MNIEDMNYMMRVALEEAEKAYREDEVPIGAVITDENGKIISKKFNQKEKVSDPCGHAEILAIREAAKKLGNWRLSTCTLFVTLEPCPMCLAALVQARIKNIIFGAYDKKGGSISLGYSFYKDKRLNHNFSVMGGLLHFESSKILSSFFRNKRMNYKQKHKKE